MMLIASLAPAGSSYSVAFVSSQDALPVSRRTLRVSSAGAVSPATSRRPGSSSRATGDPSSCVMWKRFASSPGSAWSTSSALPDPSSFTAARFTYTVLPRASCTVTASPSEPRIPSSRASVVCSRAASAVARSRARAATTASAAKTVKKPMR